MTEQKYPEPTCAALIFNKNGKMLLVKSFKWFDKWTLPGGHIELGETKEQALKREIKEEVGLDIEVVDFLMVQDFIFDKQFAKKKHFVFLDFVAKCEDDKVSLDKDEIQDYNWVDPKEALKIDIDSFTRIMLEEYFRKYPDGFS